MTATLTIRADASSTIGTGHVMRMIALGQAWQDQGGPVRFLGDVGPLAGRLADEGFAVEQVPAPHPAPADLATLLSLTGPGDWIVLDGYHFDAHYQQAVRAAGRRTLVVDDVADRGEYFADLLLNQNADATRYDYRINRDAGRLLGLRHLLLRREFLRKTAKTEAPERARNLLVTLGGGNPGKVAFNVAAALSALDDPALHVKIVSGSLNPRLDALREAAAAQATPCEVLTDVRDMAPLMEWADLALCGAGSTCWELAYLGVPMVAFVIADNQRGIARELSARNIAVVLEADAAVDDIASHVAALIEDGKARQAMADNGRALVDGRGAARVADAIRAASLRLRPARPEDSALLLEWRNAPEVRERSFTTDVIDPVRHKQWFAEKLASPDSLLYIAEDEDGKPAGQIRFDRRDNAAVVSVSVAPDRSGRGLGTAMTRRACTAMAAHWPETRVLALIKRDNPASAAMFRKAGFTEIEPAEDHLQFEWDGNNEG